MMIPKIKLSKICNISMGQAPKGSSYNDVAEGYPLIAGAGDFGISTPNPKKHTVEPTRLSQVGDLILCIRATIGDLNWSDDEYCLGRGVAGLRPLPDKVDKNYLWHFLQSYKDELQKKGTGSTFKQISRLHIEELEVPLPALKEQKRIAAILDKADAVRRKRQQAIELSEQLLRSVFLDMFGDPVSNSKGFKLVNISDIGKIITGNTPSRKKEQYYGSEIEWIKSDNINTPFHYLTKAEEYLSKEGKLVGRCAPKNSILITCIAGSKNCIGNIAMTDREVAFNQQINAIIPNEKILLYFLYAQLLFNKGIIQNASTNSMKGMVSKSKLSNIKILLPPIVEQKKYTQFFSKAVKKLQKDNLAYNELDKLFNALTQKAFRGELSKQSETELA
ncbi:restriction endonuclease subunit S [Legionella qingyii]|nr:restriction endonuclease subunit S [Legionella qingyii]